MTNIVKKISTFALTIGATALIAGCSTTCGGPRHHKKHHEHNRQPATQEVVMYEMSETVVAEIPVSNVMKAQMYTRSSRGGTSEMGYIKFANGENGMKMMVDLIDLRPGRDYTVKIYKCGNCTDYSCCTSSCMNASLPMLAIDEPGRLTKTFNVSGIKWKDLNNAKIVLTRDGGYKAAWGKIYSVENF